MSESDIQHYCRKVKEVLKDLTLTDRLRITEKVSKKWRRDSNIQTTEELKNFRKAMGIKKPFDGKE